MANERNTTIDSFRGIAVLGVLAFHYTTACTPPNDTNLCSHDGWYPAWLSLGAFGVQLFFVISGLVITMTVVRSANWHEFVAKRVARLWPAFLVAASLTFVCMRLFGPPVWQVEVRDYLVNWTMLAPLFGSPYVDGAYWSLGPEIKFYVWIALSTLLLRERFWIGPVLVGLLGIVAQVFSPALADGALDVSEMPFFLLGMSAYFGIFERRYGVAAICGAAAFINYIFVPIDIFQAPGVPIWITHLLLVGLAGVMIALLHFGVSLRFGPLVWVGRISYSLYLLHNRLGVTLISYLNDAGLPDLASVAITTVIMMGLAWALFSVVEQLGARWVMALYRYGASQIDRVRLAVSRRPAA